MKGAELPINTIVIIVLALVILLAVIALFFGVWSTGLTGVTLETAKNNACQKLTSMNCIVETKMIMIGDFDADQDGTMGGTEVDPLTNGIKINGCAQTGATSATGDNLFMLCKCHYGISGALAEQECATNVCRCPS